MTLHEREIARILHPDAGERRLPVLRSECVDGPRPCPFVSCQHHLYIDVAGRTGAIIMNFPDIKPEELTESCALDVADRGGATLEDVGEYTNLTRERIRQLEVRALDKLKALCQRRGWRLEDLLGLNSRDDEAFDRVG